jgi:hypothetical protein
MGGGASRPTPSKFEDDPYPGLQQPRLDNVSRSMANECKDCKLEVLTGTSTATVKLSREFGSVSGLQCGSYMFAKRQVQEKQLSLQDFMASLQEGKYYRDNGQNNGHCEQLTITAEEASKIKDINEVDGKVTVNRIQSEKSGGFSASTKALITPSIPFKMRLSAAGNTREVTIKNMTLYHPCPLRIEGIQYDAVLSLNDPFKADSEFVVLLPIVGANKPSPSADFLGKIMSQVVSVSAPDPASGRYLERDISTGTDWSLRKLFNTNPSDPKEVENTPILEITDGFYQWVGVSGLKRERVELRYSDLGMSTVRGFNPVVGYKTKWVSSGEPSPMYLMLDRPLICNPADLAVLTQRFPATPPEEAINPVLYSDNPLQRGIVHKQGATPFCDSREGFANADLKGVYGLTSTSTQEEEACDAWSLWAQATAGKGFSPQQMVAVVFNFLVFLAMCVGAFLAFNAALRYYDVRYSEVSTTLGKIGAVFAKNLQQKAVALQNKMASIPTGLSGLRNPGAMLAQAKGAAIENKIPAGLSEFKNPETLLEEVKSVVPEDTFTSAVPAQKPGKGLTRQSAFRRGRGRDGSTRRGDH